MIGTNRERKSKPPYSHGSNINSIIPSSDTGEGFSQEGGRRYPQKGVPRVGIHDTATKPKHKVKVQVVDMSVVIPRNDNSDVRGVLGPELGSLEGCYSEGGMGCMTRGPLTTASFLVLLSAQNKHCSGGHTTRVPFTLKKLPHDLGSPPHG